MTRPRRRPTLVAVAVAAALVAAACTERLEEGEGFDPATPEFATDDHAQQPAVGQGDVARIPPDVTVSAVSYNGERLVTDGEVCLATGVTIEGVSGYQAQLPERDGRLTVRVFSDTMTGEADLFLDGEAVEVGELRAEIQSGDTWYLEEEGAVPEGDGLIVVFRCPTPAEDARETPTGPDPQDDDLQN
jgi:hypothetical protein